MGGGLGVGWEWQPQSLDSASCLILICTYFSSTFSVLFGAGAAVNKVEAFFAPKASVVEVLVCSVLRSIKTKNKITKGLLAGPVVKASNTGGGKFDP